MKFQKFSCKFSKKYLILNIGFENKVTFLKIYKKSFDIS